MSIKTNYNTQVFLELLRTGLWEKEIRPLRFDGIDYEVIYQLADSQAVVGLVAAGMEHIKGTSALRKDVMPFLSRVVALEQRNAAMNSFIQDLMGTIRSEGIECLLIKGQGIAQCYERPHWRAAGDVDLFLDSRSFEKAALFLPSLASSNDENRPETKHFAMTIGPWEVELHGTLRSQLGRRIDRVIDQVQWDTFENRRFRVWKNGSTDVILPGPDNDVFFVFTHILQHFLRGGIGLRQICDWCRLLWTFRDDIDRPLLETRIRASGLFPEWKSFATFAVEYLEMPEEAMPFYSASSRWKRKAEVILSFVLETGNFGHNRDMSYQKNSPYVFRKAISLWRHTWDGVRHFFVFPDIAVQEWWRMMKEGIKRVAKGK